MTNWKRGSTREALKKEFKLLKKENPSLKGMSFADFKNYVKSIKKSAGPQKAVEHREAEELLEGMFLEESVDEEDTTAE